MFIRELALKNFRNYKNLYLEFAPGINLITGDNAAGKTNILEAISVVSGLKSFRNVSDPDMVKWGEDSYFCSSTLGDSAYTKFEIGYSLFSAKIQKKAKIDGAAKRRISDYYGKFLTVIFSPDDIALITGPPDLRRRYFDSIISKIDADYLNSLGDYKKILISRNKLLRDIRETKRNRRSELDIWDNMLAKRASGIIKKRNDFLRDFNLSFISSNLNISENDISPQISYISAFSSYEEDFLIKELAKSRDKDIVLGSTQTGPHRDDFVFLFKEGKIYKYFASQGQKRTVSISLKIAECKYIEKEAGKKPVILIDDIFGELDDKRRNKMMDIFKENGQIIITAANPDLMHSDEREIRRFFVLPEGIVEKL